MYRKLFLDPASKCGISVLKEIPGKMTQTRKMIVRKKPAVQRLRRNARKFDPDDFWQKGKSAAKLGQLNKTFNSEGLGQTLM